MTRCVNIFSRTSRTMMVWIKLMKNLEIPRAVQSPPPPKKNSCIGIYWARSPIFWWWRRQAARSDSSAQHKEGLSDRFDQQVDCYSVARITNRWPAGDIVFLSGCSRPECIYNVCHSQSDLQRSSRMWKAGQTITIFVENRWAPRDVTSLIRFRLSNPQISHRGSNVAFQCGASSIVYDACPQQKQSYFRKISPSNKVRQLRRY